MEEPIFIRDDIFKSGVNGLSVVANKCNRCGKIAFPKTKYCVHCFNKEMTEVEISRRGKLYSYTITHYPVSKFNPPHAIGLIDLPEGIRIHTPLVMGNKEFKVGSEMEMVIGPVWMEDGKAVIGYKFKDINN